MSIIKIENIKYISQNENIIHGITLDIKKGEMISIVGKSGSGKSTFLKLLSDLMSVSSGDMYFMEKSYKEYDPIKLRKKISYCVQIPYLFGETVYDNLTYPFYIRKENIDINKIKDFMNKFNLDESYINKDINLLSGGEKQRVALIRNLMFTPDVLLLDEVTASLDNENTKVVEDIIKDMNNKGTTVLWITHDLSQSEGMFDRRITIENGKIIKEEDFR